MVHLDFVSIGTTVAQAETTFDAVVADGPRAGKWKALGGSLKKLAGALGSTKLRGSNFNSDAAVVATSDETAGGVDESHLGELILLSISE